MNKKQKVLWNKLIKAMVNSNSLFHLEYANEYTSKYQDDMYGWIALADVLSSIAFYKEAKSALDKANRLCPEENKYTVYEQYGHYYLQKCSLKMAEKWYKKAVTHKKRQVNLIFLGACLAKQGKFDEAKEYHKKAIKSDPAKADEAYFNLGLILKAEGDLKKALHYFDKALAIDPKYSGALKHRNEIVKFLESHGQK